MDDTEDDARYPPNLYGMNRHYGSLHFQMHPARNASYPQHVGDRYVENEDEDEVEVDVDDEDEEEEEEEEEEVDDINDDGVMWIGKEEDKDDEDEDDASHPTHPKKRKLKSLLSSYEFAPRVPAPSSAAAPVPRSSFGRRNSLADWSEHETFILLDAWGDRFLQHGRKSLQSEEWQEVAEKVSQESKRESTDTQCRNRLDTLKKKYKKEKMKIAELRSSTSKWVYFTKLDVLLSSSSKEACLSCGVDSGEYVFMNTNTYLNCANGFDELMDSPRNSESAGSEEDNSDGVPPRGMRKGADRGDGGSFQLLADSIQKFGEIYEKVENSKRQQMLELEKMRMDFHRELELQKRQTLERAQAEITKIRQGDDEENDASAENDIG